MFLHERVRFLIFLLILLGIGATFYRESLSALATIVLHREGSSHSLFVPFISAYFLWLKFDKIKGMKPKSSRLPGGAMLLGGFFLFFLSSITSFSLPLSILSYLFIAGALVLLLFGKVIFRETVFSLFFLATMIPLPTAVYNQIAYWMRVTNTWGAVAVTKVLGVPLYREEFNVFLPGINLFVADSCSGIRYLLSYFTFSIVYAVLFKHSSNFARLLVVLGSIPLSVLAGITRLTVIFLAAHYISPVMAEHRPHIILSWAVFVTWLVLIVAVDQYMCRVRK